MHKKTIQTVDNYQLFCANRKQLESFLQAFMLKESEEKDYIWKSTTVMGGIYLFYITEKVMRMINDRREVCMTRGMAMGKESPLEDIEVNPSFY